MCGNVRHTQEEPKRKTNYNKRRPVWSKGENRGVDREEVREVSESQMFTLATKVSLEGFEQSSDMV